MLMTQYTAGPRIEINVRKIRGGHLQLSIAAGDRALVHGQNLALAVKYRQISAPPVMEQMQEGVETPGQEEVQPPPPAREYKVWRAVLFHLENGDCFTQRTTADGTQVQYTSREPVTWKTVDFTTASGSECALLVRPTVCAPAPTCTLKRSRATAFGEEGASGAAEEEASGAASGAAEEEEEEDYFEYLDSDSGGASVDEEEEEAEKADDHPGDVSDNEELAALPKNDGRYDNVEGCSYQWEMVRYAQSLRRQRVRARAKNVWINARNASRDRRRARRAAPQAASASESEAGAARFRRRARRAAPQAASASGSEAGAGSSETMVASASGSEAGAGSRETVVDLTGDDSD